MRKKLATYQLKLTCSLDTSATIGIVSTEHISSSGLVLLCNSLLHSRYDPNHAFLTLFSYRRNFALPSSQHLFSIIFLATLFFVPLYMKCMIFFCYFFSMKILYMLITAIFMPLILRQNSKTHVQQKDFLMSVSCILLPPVSMHSEEVFILPVLAPLLSPEVCLDVICT